MSKNGLSIWEEVKISKDRTMSSVDFGGMSIEQLAEQLPLILHAARCFLHAFEPFHPESDPKNWEVYGKSDAPLTVFTVGDWIKLNKIFGEFEIPKKRPKSGRRKNESTNTHKHRTT